MKIVSSNFLNSFRSNSKTIIIIFLLSLTIIHGCKMPQNGKRTNPPIEVVLVEGMKIKATNIHGTIIIEAGQDYVRRYTWDGATRTVKLTPRNERWNGRFGIYSAGNCDWKPHNRIDRGVLEEAQLHRSSIDDALVFLKHRSRKEYTVYRDDGLAVSWRKAIKPTPGSGSALIVDVWQIYIGGKKPTKLPGSQNDKILIIQ